jgi:lactate permease
MPNALVAALPIALVLVLMLAVRWSAVRAGLAGLALALFLAWTIFPFASVGEDRVMGTGGALVEAAFTAATIIWIILPALAIYQLQERTGAVGALRTGLAELSRDPRLTALLVAWFFSLLLEGAAGFGTAAALAAPFLVALGMSPLTAVTAAMLGHVVGVTFGAVGTPIVPQVAASGLAPIDLSTVTALQAAIVGWTVPIIVMLGIKRAYPEAPPRPSWASWALGLGAAAAFLVPYLLIAFLVGPELPTLGGAIVGGAIFVAALRRGRGRAGDRGTVAEPAAADSTTEPAAAGSTATISSEPPAGMGSSESPAGMGLLRAMAPYLILVALVLTTRLVGPLRDGLRGLEIAWEGAGGVFEASVAPLYHPGTMLFLALLLGAWVQRATREQVSRSLVGALRTLVPVAVALMAMLGLARVMVHAGMVEAIATAAADTVGDAWPVLAPAVGMLGTFVTGSATASNALFSDLQVATADAIGQDAGWVLGAQGLGAALGNAIAPHNLIAAAAIVGLAGRESEILRRTFPVVLPLIIAAGLVALVLGGR